MSMNSNRFRHALLGASAMVSAAAVAGAAYAADTRAYDFDMPAQPLTLALKTFGATADQQLIFSESLVRDRTAPALKGSYTPDQALAMLLSGSGLTADKTPGGVVTIRSASDPQGGSASDGADGTVQALIVTAQKREENIQDVPIAMSAFSQEDLTRSQVAGGPDLITQVPNMTFTKTNFSSYSIQLRGIGTQAISATTDPAVAVAFNNTPFIRNRFFEQEFYDLQRVEVLRGPQGTLYGRNATAGVVNIISQKPKFRYEARLSADVGNFSSSRLEGMVNIPLVEDRAALRVAGAWTKRDGYAENQITDNPIDGRDLWSTRVSLRLAPSDAIDINLIWEHFEENDDRLRSGKQLCKKDVVTEVAGMPVGYLDALPNTGQGGMMATANANFSQGCERESLYSPDSFQTPMGLMLPYYVPLGGIGLQIARQDPYLSQIQSPDLRTIESTIDPKYQAKSDIGELQISVDITPNLTLASETAYGSDTVFSLQDFNRFDTAPGAWTQPRSYDRPDVLLPGPNGGIFCDPQLGCSDRLVAADISTADATQFSQEFRLSSDFDGALNFSLGANFLRADSFDKYYVFINSLSLIAATGKPGNVFPPYVVGQTTNLDCMAGAIIGNPADTYPVVGCTYIDPNPIGRLNDRGHNYFLSNNPYKLISYAAFGEAYYQVTDTLKVTAGLRWTVDKKEAPRIPSWLLAINTVGYPVAEVIEQEWREPTGRLAIDWKPDLGFTDETLLYASYAHGYKAGGANPPGFVRVFYSDPNVAAGSAAASATRPKTFDAEYVNAFELGAKNTLADGRMTVNLAGFYYDYTGYQISEIVDRSAFNRNFDATVWGIELESDWRPFENLRLGLKGGYEKTRIADDEQAIDLMDRTAGDDRWMVVRPFPTYASSCILPTWLMIANQGGQNIPALLGGGPGGNATGCELAYGIGEDPGPVSIYRDGVINYTQWSTDPNDYPGVVWPGGVVTDRTYPGWDPATAPNGGEGIMKPLGGNELPNAPHITATFTSDYTVPLPNEWLMTLHGDVHWQSQSWWRVFNDNVYDKLHPYFTMNLAAIFTNEDAGWNIMAYIKNITDETAITGAFLNSDDTGLTTNVFLTEPRLYGLRLTKNFTGGPLLGSFGERHDGPYPFTVELGGQAQRIDAPNEVFAPDFMASFPAGVDPRGLENDDLGWNGGGEVKLAYNLPSGWSLAVATRFGQTKRSDDVLQSQRDEFACLFGPLCPVKPKYQVKASDWSQSNITEKEEHTIADFTIGRDVGIGMLSASRLSGGLRYAHLTSSTMHDVNGTPDWMGLTPTMSMYADVQHHLYDAELAADRTFQGLGPVISWDASKRFIDFGDTGGVDLAWTLSGGVLFGKQKSSIGGSVTDSSYDEKYSDFYFSTPAGPVSVDRQNIDIRRSKSVTAPVFAASLGLAYEVGGLKVGTGYRWERYFNAIDGGYAEHKSYDRTIDGPYFTIAVGFGG